jgi:hypothetical protein
MLNREDSRRENGGGRGAGRLAEEGLRDKCVQLEGWGAAETSAKRHKVLAQPISCATAKRAGHKLCSTSTPAPALHIYLRRCLVSRFLHLSRRIRFLGHCGE